MEASRVRELPDEVRAAWPFDPLIIHFVQVKYTNRNSSNAIRTRFVAEPAANFDNVCILINALLYVQKGEGAEEDILLRRSGFFWIKSSAKRAFGGCLGSKRR